MNIIIIYKRDEPLEPGKLEIINIKTNKNNVSLDKPTCTLLNYQADLDLECSIDREVGINDNFAFAENLVIKLDNEEFTQESRNDFNSVTFIYLGTCECSPGEGETECETCETGDNVKKCASCNTGSELKDDGIYSKKQETTDTESTTSTNTTNTESTTTTGAVSTTSGSPSGNPDESDNNDDEDSSHFIKTFIYSFLIFLFFL